MGCEQLTVIFPSGSGLICNICEEMHMWKYIQNKNDFKYTCSLSDIIIHSF